MLSLDVERALATLTSELLHAPIPGFSPRAVEDEARRLALLGAGVSAETPLRDAEARLLAAATRADSEAEAALHRLEALVDPSPDALVAFHTAARRARAAWDLYYHAAALTST